MIYKSQSSVFTKQHPVLINERKNNKQTSTDRLVS